MKSNFIKVRFISSIIFASSILFVQCGEDDELDFSNPDVELYVKQVKNGSFTSELLFEMPHFKKADIPKLLEYAKDTSLVKAYPVNPVSSFWVSAPTLSQVLLWTVESIRVGGEFPSLSCQLCKKKAETKEVINLIVDKKEILLVRDLYQSWWDKVTNQSSSVNYYQKSPLEGSDYSWW